jgi:hypothetical protein
MLEGGILKRIIVLAAVVAIAAAMLAASSVLSIGSAQDGAAGQAHVCAPWSKAWDLSEGQWYFSWYRWCYDPALYDPYYESSWYTEQGSWEWGEKANLCPESGTCTMSPGGGMNMTTGTP